MEGANTIPTGQGSSPWVDTQRNPEAWAKHEKEFSCNAPPPDSGPAQLSRRSPTVSGGLPSLNKARR